jgi:hypothetical protein
MKIRALSAVLLVIPAMGGCASLDSGYQAALQNRNAIGDQCNEIRDAWRAQKAEGATVEEIEAGRQRVMTCAAYFRQAQANLEAAWVRHRAAMQDLSRGLNSLGNSFEAAGSGYGPASQSISASPSVPQPVPAPGPDGMYVRPDISHGCVGNVPVQGPGLNPCPSR